MKHIKGQNGYTLVELLVVIAISGIIITAAYTFLFTNQSTFFSVKAQADAQNEARAALDQVMTSIRRADQKALSDISGGNELALQIPNSQNEKEEFRYFVENNDATNRYELILKTETGTHVVADFIDGMNGFQVSNENGKLITVKIKIVVQKYNKIFRFDTENYHAIKIDL